MDTSKDYYRTLGVLPTAEDLIIKAAYRALSQRYHPDKNPSPDSARRMAEINEAYAILSDKTKRAAYDQARGTHEGPDTNDFESDPEPTTDPLSQDWLVATRFYPDLEILSSQLKQVSWRLENSYRAYLLESKRFDRRTELAQKFEYEFLARYFGNNDSIINFARSLIKSGERAAACDLNNSVRVLGSKTKAALIISTIKKQHGITQNTTPNLINLIKQGECSYEIYNRALEENGGKLKPLGFLSGKYQIEFNGESYVLQNFSKIRPWILEHLT